MPGEKDDFTIAPDGLNSDSTATQEETKLLTPEGQSDANQGGGQEDDRVVENEAPTAEEAAELANAANDEEREAIRARRRVERKQRRQHQKDNLRNLEMRVAALSQQNQELQRQVASVHSMTMGQQMVRIDDEVRRAKAAENEFQDIIADAISKGDGRVVAEATKSMAAVSRSVDELAQLRQRVGQMAQQKSAPQLDSAVVANAKAFMEDNGWYKSGSEDTDSRIVTMLDNSMSSEGWDPALPVYWEELRRRAARYLPHRFPQGAKTGDNSQQRRGPGGVGGGGSGSGGGGSGASSGGYTLSAERVKAMKDAGIWDDPKRRAAQVKRYQDYDRQSSH